MDGIVKLVSVTYETDDIGQMIPVETARRIFCEIESVGQSEFFEAGRSGLKADKRIIVHSSEYRGEQTAMLGTARYGIYRTYDRQNGQTELYLESKGGLQ